MATPKTATKVEEAVAASSTAKTHEPVVAVAPAASNPVAVEAPKAATTTTTLAAAAPAPTPAPAVKTEEAPKSVVAAVEAPMEAAATVSVASTSEETPKVEETARELPAETEALEQDLPEASPVEPSIPEYAEESNVVADLKTHEKKSLEEFKLRIEKAIKDGEFRAVKKVIEAPKETETPVVPELVKEITETPAAATETTTTATDAAEPSAATEEAKEAVVEEKSKEVSAAPVVTPAAPVEEKVTEKTKEAPVAPAPAAPVTTPVEAKPTVSDKAKEAAAPAIAAVTHIAEKVAEKAKEVTASGVAAVTHAAEKVAEKAKEAAHPTPAPAPSAAPAAAAPVVEKKTKDEPAVVVAAATAPVVEEKAKDVASTSEPVLETVTPVFVEDPEAVDESEVAATPAAQDSEETIPDEDISLWGVPLLHLKGDRRTDVILLKFLRARDFNVNQAFKQLKKTIIWRREFKTDSILEEEFGTDLDGVAFMHGQDKEGHPVCYNVFGTFQDKELYQKTFGDAAKITAFLRWRVQVLEKGIGLLNFTPEGPSAMVQIADMKNTGFFNKKDLKSAANQATDVLQDNYPEMVARKIFVNAPWYFSALYSVVSPFLSQRTKSKFTVAPAGKTTEHLLKFIPAEHIPVYYGGLSRANDSDFAGVDAPVQELILKAGEKQSIEIPLEKDGSAVWDVTVVGYEVNYEAEFVPSAEGAYAITIEKSKKLPASTDAPVRSTFKAPEAGKVVVTVDNSSKKKKIVLYRYIVKAEETKSSA
ncbi:hypothetical protein Mapa_005697 [Marchantia paleacea]|nr:hypothetical protein Mapa_005697 [Marchantia paleacea]